MEGLSVTASGLAVVSVAFQVAETCTKLYLFWESIEDAPSDIEAIKEDLRYLSSVFTEVAHKKKPLGYSVVQGIEHCQRKVANLASIVEKFDVGFQSSSKRKRAWAAFKASARSKQVQKFRESLNETKSTLALAMIHQCILQSQICAPSTDANVLQDLVLPPTYSSTRLDALLEDLAPFEQAQMISSTYWKENFSLSVPLVSNDVARNALKEFDKAAVKRPVVSAKAEGPSLYTVDHNELLKTTSTEIFTQKQCAPDDRRFIASMFACSKYPRYRVYHRTSSLRIAFGYVWRRKTTVHLDNDTDDMRDRSQSVTSLVFYPTTWVQRIGIRNGVEVMAATNNKSWHLNIRVGVTRAVPEDSPIFELCRTGQTQAVQTLISKGIGSVVDTSLKGWKPLHFAAAGGHVDLCAMLIREGADKSALVYEGPSPCILSPITLFAAFAGELDADTKISMLRLFWDCIDITSPKNDGWIVREWLKKAYAKERVPLAQTSHIWLMRSTAKEQFVFFGPETMWSCIQYAVRSLLLHERNNQFLYHILGLSEDEYGAISPTHANAIRNWLVLRCTESTLLRQLILDFGPAFQMNGFDWVENNLTWSQIVKGFPEVYAQCCHSWLDLVDKMEEYMRSDLEACLEKLGWTQDVLLNAISRRNTIIRDLGEEHVHKKACICCKDDYTALGLGLVEPARIAVTECIKTNHKFECTCLNRTNDIDRVDSLKLTSTGLCHEESDIDEDFFDAQPCLTDATEGPRLIETPDSFFDTATMLYRAQGRVWMGEYEIGDHYCISCFLLKEKYISEDGLGTESNFPSMPESFKTQRAEQGFDAIYDVVSN